MKPAPFALHLPESLSAATRLLADLPESRVLAGGQSLMPMLNLRLTTPAHLVALDRVPGLDQVRIVDGRIVIGARVRQQDLARSPVIRDHAPIFAEAIAEIGHRATRNRGTFGGSLCHLDPASELPALALLHDAELTIAAPHGGRTRPFAGFALGPMSPDLDICEIVTDATFVPWPRDHGWAFLEAARRRGDFAVVGVAALIAADADGRIARAAIALAGASATAVRAEDAERELIGRPLAAETFAAAAEAAAATADLDDPLTPVQHRRDLARSLVRRALTRAATRLGGAAR